MTDSTATTYRQTPRISRGLFRLAFLLWVMLIAWSAMISGPMARALANTHSAPPVQIFLEALQREVQLAPQAGQIMRTPEGHELRNVVFGRTVGKRSLTTTGSIGRITLENAKEADGVAYFSVAALPERFAQVARNAC